MTADERLVALRERLRKIAEGGIALAYSGGVDSALLLAVLAELRREKNFPLLALTMRSPFSPQGADDVPADIPSETLDVALADVPAALRENAAERCYFCKKHFFSAFAEIARERGLRTLAEQVKEAFGLPDVRIFGDPGKRVKRAAILPGSGKSAIPEALRQQAQVLITGDMGHHEGIDAVAQGLAVIDGGHYGIEHIFIEDVKEYLEERLPDVEVCAAPVRHPFRIV